MSGQTQDAVATTIEIQDKNPSPQSSPKRSKMKSNLGANDAAARPPPLDIQPEDEVIVINADRSSLSWKRYKLIENNVRTGVCIVEGISDSRQRNFPRALVKPKGWIDSFRAFFHTMAAPNLEEKEEKQQHHFVEFKNFYQAMQLLGAKYDHETCLRVFKALDVRANGILSFAAFLNWVYGLGRTADRGRLLTTIECVTGQRKWSNMLTYYVMETDIDDSEGGPKQNIWSTAAYDASVSSADTIHLIATNQAAANPLADILSEDDDGNLVSSHVFQIPANLDAFRKEFGEKLSDNTQPEVYQPSNEYDERECSVVVMGPGEIGKTALISKFVKGTFPHDYDPTIQDHARKQILVDGNPALLDILDTAGQDEFASMRYDWLKDGVDILLICFSRFDHESFVRAEELVNTSRRLLRQHRTPKTVPILLVGTKKDEGDLRPLQVTTEDIQDLRDRYGGEKFIGYEECSSLSDDNVLGVFEEAVKMYRKWRNDKSAGIMIRFPTIKEIADNRRRYSAVQQFNEQTHENRRRCILCLGKLCPAMAAYMDSEESTGKLQIAAVPKDKFGDELAEPSYSKQHFFVKRNFSYTRFVYGILAAIFFPLLITVQTLIFVFYCGACNCCYRCFPEGADFADSQTAMLWDFFAPIVGRDPRESAKEDDARKWFLSQTCGQKFSRIVFTILIDVLFFFAWFNAITVGLQWFDVGSANGDELAIVETLGPGQLWMAMWLVLSVYISLDIDVMPEPPSMQSLRPFVMYLNKDESIRTTAYVFLRGFSKSTLTIFRLEATFERQLSSFVVALIYTFIPGVIRVGLKVDGGGKFFPDGLALNAATAMVVNFVFLWFLVLGLQMQLLSGLVKYIDWMNDITSMLDEQFSNKKKLHYINLTRHNNTLAWLEMRTYLYTKGLIIFSRQEIFVLYVIFLQIATALYILFRLMFDEFENTYGSPSFVGILFIFLLLTYALGRMLRTTRMIERLQTKQIALLAAQKFQIYYRRITWHPDQEQQQHELSREGGDYADPAMYDPDWADIDPNNLPAISDPVEESDEDEKTEKDALLGKLDAAAPIDQAQVSLTSEQISPQQTSYFAGHTTAIQHSGGSGGAAVEDQMNSESMFSAEYLEQSEKLVQATINICEAQDIIPRVFNMKVQVAVGLSILCTFCAVIPTAARLAFGSDCSAWSD
eukprot:CAMPEP_0197031808 /NCGR_PEP_ID=MMETSP1384-20130603/10684_1 /TAXON_ID=29189 /ORGANISM="Ammonia sp." /LENGTH=1173 /DNA_ID=CAMNT_0042461383 /DNA_START=139 /DNA_END=3663 /DNA_ORIENTATION=-